MPRLFEATSARCPLHRPRFFNSPWQAPLAEACCSCGILAVWYPCILICGQAAWETHGISQNSPSDPGTYENIRVFPPLLRDRREVRTATVLEQRERWSRKSVPVGQQTEISHPRRRQRVRDRSQGSHRWRSAAPVRSIIEAHGGRLWVTANLPPGAIFHFTVPTHPDSAS
jgi:hypothetical protein